MTVKKFKIRMRLAIVDAEGYATAPIMAIDLDELVPPGHDAGPYLKERVEMEWKRLMGTRIDLVEIGSEVKTA